MSETWFTSDLHLGHANILKFEGTNGSLLRPGFDNVLEMKDHIFKKWRETVKPGDKVYVLGDVALGSLGREHLLDMRILPGNKYLVLGNHDKYDMGVYSRVFHHVYGARFLDGFWLTHIPVHPRSFGFRKHSNIHGHTHDSCVTQYDGFDDPRYFNVSVEFWDYTPVPFELLKKQAQSRIGGSLV